MEFLRLIIVFSVVLTAAKSSTPPQGNPGRTTGLPSNLCLQQMGCECTDSGKVISLVCNNITDFDGLQKLANTSIFGSRTIEITLKGIRVIPPNIIRNLNVFTLTLNDSFIDTISFDVFNGTKVLHMFNIKSSSIQALPNFEYVHQTLEHLNLDRSKLMAIELEVQNLTILKTLTFRDNFIRTVNENAFRGLRTLQILDLSSNHLTSLPSQLFNDLTNLKSLILSFNQLSFVGDLFSAIKPTSIYLDHNNLTNASDIFYSIMKTVEDIDLSHNPLKTIDNHTFNGYIPNTRFLSLDHCSLTAFDFEHISALSNLRRVNLSSNFIEHIGKGIVNFGDNLEIYLDDNRISLFETELTFTVERLHMSDNSMRHLGMTLQLTQIPDVEINRNQLEAILESDLKGMHGTANLSVSQNLISRIDTWAFSASLRSDLEALDLSWNQLRTLNGSINYLARLTTLNISHNKIEILRQGEFIGLNELKNMYLQNNQIVVLQGLQSIPQLHNLMVQFNNLTTVSAQQLPKSLQSLHYKGNPIKCNCRFYPFLKWLENSDSPKTDSDYCQRLDESQSNNKTYSNTIGLKSFNVKKCPQPCKCSCSRNLNDTFMAVDCSSQGIVSVLDPFKTERNSTINGQSMMMWQNADPRFALEDRILVINLQNNEITSLENWTFPSDLRTLELARNQLTRLTTTVMSLRFLRWISLSGNPWVCDCESLDFKKWVILKMSGIRDANDTHCSSVDSRSKLNGKLLVSLSDLDLCPVALGLYIMIVFVVLVLLLVVAALKIAYNQYKVHIHIWLNANGIKWKNENEIDQDKLFDVFLSFSNSDEPFVLHFISEIKSRVKNINLCLHFYHFKIGELIQVNIENAVKYSKRTVLILTNEFLESDWCLMEFHTAHAQAQKDRINRIIVIKVGDLPNKMDETLKAYLESKTYLTWGEKYFWKKLLEGLPTSTGQRKEPVYTVNKLDLI